MTKIQEVNQFVGSMFEYGAIKIDTKRLQRNGLANYIFDIILSADLRLGPRTKALSQYIQARVYWAIERAKPIEFAITTGSYKNIHVSSSPHIDWAEAFQLSHILQVLFPVSLIYPPGIVLEYSGDAGAMCFIDNLKPEWVETYNNEFLSLLKRVQPVLPANVVLRMKNVEQFYDLEELERSVEAKIVVNDWQDPAIIELIQSRKERAVNNICWNGREDWRTISENEKAQKLAESILKHKFYLEIDFERRANYLTGNERIVILHRTGFPDCYPIVSVKGTDVQYWEGTGVLIKARNTFRPWILSPKQVSQFELMGVEADESSWSKELKSLDELPIAKKLSI